MVLKRKSWRNVLMWLTENGSVTGSLLTETGFSHAKMGRVSSIVKRLSLKVVEQFLNIVPVKL